VQVNFHKTERQSHITETVKVIAFAVTIRFMHNLTQFSNSNRGATMPGKEKETRRVFARNFKQARKEANLTQEDIVKMTGLTQPFISRVENARTTINIDNAELLAVAVKKPLWILLNPVKK
jgi:DNA-binding XRE family transcriptional regulator